MFPVKSPDKNSPPEPAPKPRPKPEVFRTLKTTKAKIKRKISPVKLREEFLNEIANEEKTSDELFKTYFGYHNASFLEKYLFKDNKAENEVNDSSTNLRNAVNKEEIPKVENLDKVIKIIKRILDFNNQQKGNVER